MILHFRYLNQESLLSFWVFVSLSTCPTCSGNSAISFEFVGCNFFTMFINYFIYRFIMFNLEVSTVSSCDITLTFGLIKTLWYLMSETIQYFALVASFKVSRSFWIKDFGSFLSIYPFFTLDLFIVFFLFQCYWVNLSGANFSSFLIAYSTAAVLRCMLSYFHSSVLYQYTRKASSNMLTYPTLL